ncbi:MAG: ABC transporter substrate-binding protein [Myxococcota bacterium]
MNPCRSSALALCLALLAAASPARADENVASASAFMKTTVDEVLAILNDKQVTGEARLSKLEAIALERFDFPRMALLVLGKNRKELTPAQLEQFKAEFKQSLSNTYGRRLDRYTSNEKIEMGESRLEPNKDVTVKTRVVGGAAGDGVQIDYRLRAAEGGSGWLIIDVIPAGVSLIQNFRSQVQEIVTQKGVGQLIETLREKNQQAPDPATATR